MSKKAFASVLCCVNSKGEPRLDVKAESERRLLIRAAQLRANSRKPDACAPRCSPQSLLLLHRRSVHTTRCYADAPVRWQRLVCRGHDGSCPLQRCTWGSTRLKSLLRFVMACRTTILSASSGKSVNIVARQVSTLEL